MSSNRGMHENWDRRLAHWNTNSGLTSMLCRPNVSQLLVHRKKMLTKYLGQSGPPGHSYTFSQSKPLSKLLVVLCSPQRMLETSPLLPCNPAVSTGFCLWRSKFMDLQHPSIVFKCFPVLWGHKCSLRFQFLSLNDVGEIILWSRCPLQGVGL